MKKKKKYAYGSGLSGLEGVGSQVGSVLQNSGMKGMGQAGV